MGYVIAAVVVLVLVAGFITYFVLNAKERSGDAAPSDPGSEGSPAGIAAPDSSPLGDTAEHSGETAREGSDHPGESPGTHGDEAPAPAEGDKPRVGDPGPEAESGSTPESEHLADRPR